jgi:hypothetical protein
MLDSGEPGSLVAMGTCDATRPPTSSRRRGKTVRHWQATPARRGKHAAPSARAVLGPAHPLTRATEAVTGATHQWLTCAAILAGSSFAELEGHTWATVLTICSAPVLAALTVLLLILKQRVADRAIDLIAEGRETLPIATVQLHRQRLTAQGERNALAKTLETTVYQATNPPRMITRGTRPLFDIRVIAAVASDLRAVIRHLQTGNPPARAVAMIDRLITDGHSPFYGHEFKPLRQELNHIREAFEH